MYSGRKLTPSDRELPDKSKLTFYRMKMVVNEPIIPEVDELINNL